MVQWFGLFHTFSWAYQPRLRHCALGISCFARSTVSASNTAGLVGKVECKSCFDQCDELLTLCNTSQTLHQVLGEKLLQVQIICFHENKYFLSGFCDMIISWFLSKNPAQLVKDSLESPDDISCRGRWC